MAGIGIILNPHSKKHRQDPDRLKRMAFIVGDKGSCKATSDLGDLHRVAEEFKTRDIEILGIGGGDGTNHVVLTQFIRVYGEKPLPKITFLRGGTLNTLASACKIKGSPERLLSNLIYKYHEDVPFEIKEVDIIKMNEEYGFIFGTGLIYRFMNEYYKGRPSPTRAAKLLVHSIGSALVNGAFSRRIFERFNAEVWVDGKRWPFRNYSALYAGSVSEIGLHFKIFHYCEEPRRFHFSGFSMTPRQVLRYVPGMAMGKSTHSPDLLAQPASEVLIRFDEPQPYIVDGDVIAATDQIEIKTGPRLKIIVN